MQCYTSSADLASAARYTLIDITKKARNLCFDSTARTLKDYDIVIITSDLSELAMNACVATQYVAHLACKKTGATRKKLDFIDYMKAVGRHLDKARRILEQDHPFGKYTPDFHSFVIRTRHLTCID